MKLQQQAKALRLEKEQAHITEAPKEKSTSSGKHTNKGQKVSGNNARSTHKQKRKEQKKENSGETQDRKKAKSSLSNEPEQKDGDGN